ncbi:restriction system-associated AAA family ATPase [Larkinella arboricola]|uniref:Restriction system-associated AAA family ATPase n=1 Tax=Larkinella arboricola TaxID=643671 RepID=A0A327X882_LARAB|nr:restriction system-associated AAA family ATPase [Larkinella arboricola]RAK02314.1 restriction system-associated AAA family ATPase [Larkinella arboricola]
MRLLRIHIISADTCGGLLDGLDLTLRSHMDEQTNFSPLCLIGANGTGKSQFLQVLAEMFQLVFHAVVHQEERLEGNTSLLFEAEYLIKPRDNGLPVHVRIARQGQNRRRPVITIQKKVANSWMNCELDAAETQELLPRKVVGYTSGENETMSLPFLLSRSGYAEEVRESAIHQTQPTGAAIQDTRLMLIDYGTHLEVLVANLLLGSDEQRTSLLQFAHLDELHSFRCIIQLAHSAAPRAPERSRSHSRRKGIQLTDELEGYLDKLQKCATCYQYDDKTETYTFDFLVTPETKTAFRFFWKSAFDLYSAFHKLAMLNDLVIPKHARERFTKETKARRFASRLPEPQEEDKVFRFERVNFQARNRAAIVDYVSLSDGEHQLAQLLGTFSMISFPNVLFLLDEPESHFNPTWRRKFIDRLRALPTLDGRRTTNSVASQQDCLITTHSPYLPSDLPKENVFIFSRAADTRKVSVKNPEIETYGLPFDAILKAYFDV